MKLKRSFPPPFDLPTSIWVKVGDQNLYLDRQISYRHANLFDVEILGNDPDIHPLAVFSKPVEQSTPYKAQLRS